MGSSARRRRGPRRATSLRPCIAREPSVPSSVPPPRATNAATVTPPSVRVDAPQHAYRARRPRLPGRGAPSAPGATYSKCFVHFAVSSACTPCSATVSPRCCFVWSRRVRVGETLACRLHSAATDRRSNLLAHCPSCVGSRSSSCGDDAAPVASGRAMSWRGPSLRPRDVTSCPGNASSSLEGASSRHGGASSSLEGAPSRPEGASSSLEGAPSRPEGASSSRVNASSCSTNAASSPRASASSSRDVDRMSEGASPGLARAASSSRGAAVSSRGAALWSQRAASCRIKAASSSREAALSSEKDALRRLEAAPSSQCVASARRGASFCRQGVAFGRLEAASPQRRGCLSSPTAASPRFVRAPSRSRTVVPETVDRRRLPPDRCEQPTHLSLPGKERIHFVEIGCPVERAVLGQSARRRWWWRGSFPVVVGCAVAAGRFEEDEQERNRSHGSGATQRSYHQNGQRLHGGIVTHAPGARRRLGWAQPSPSGVTRSSSRSSSRSTRASTSSSITPRSRSETAARRRAAITPCSTSR